MQNDIDPDNSFFFSIKTSSYYYMDNQFNSTLRIKKRDNSL